MNNIQNNRANITLVRKETQESSILTDIAVPVHQNNENAEIIRPGL